MATSRQLWMVTHSDQGWLYSRPVTQHPRTHAPHALTPLTALTYPSGSCTHDALNAAGVQRPQDSDAAHTDVRPEPVHTHTLATQTRHTSWAWLAANIHAPSHDLAHIRLVVDVAPWPLLRPPRRLTLPPCSSSTIARRASSPPVTSSSSATHAELLHDPTPCTPRLAHTITH